MIIEIPFNAWSKKRLKEKKKCSTARTKQYGEVGDTFEVDGKEYMLIIISELSTDFIIMHCYEMEGADSREELRMVLNSIFRGRKLPETLWLHLFKEVVGLPEVPIVMFKGRSD